MIESRSSPRDRLAQFSPLIAGALGLGVVIVIIGDAAAQLGARLDGWHRPPPIAPLSLALELADGKTRWPPAATAIAAAAGGVLVLALRRLFHMAMARRVTTQPCRSRRADDGTRTRHPPRLPRKRAGDREALQHRPGRPPDRARRQRRPTAVRDAGRTSSATSGARGEARPPPARSPPSSPHPRPRLRPPTSPTSTPRRGSSASSPDRSGTSTPNSSPVEDRAGGGTRSATSRLTAAR